MKYITVIFLAVLAMSCNPITERMPYYEVHGIDVSHYQSIINWDTIAAQKIDFVFVKATEGEEMSDSLFSSNWLDIKRVGLKRGAYHFFRPGGSAHKQALNFIANVRLEAGDLPPVLDVEVTDDVSDAEIVKRIQSWVEIIENHYQIKPIIYTNLKFFDRYIDQHFDDHPIWIARYNTKKPSLNEKRDWHFWQYGNRGQLPGIEGFVDFNVFKGTLLELEAICLSFDPVYSSR